MSHENSVTKQNADGTWSNFSSVGSARRKATPLKTNGASKWKTRKEAEANARKRSDKSNWGRGNNTIQEATKEETKTVLNRGKGDIP